MRLVLISGLGLWTGSTLLLSTLSWFAQLPLAERLRPHTAGSPATVRPGVLSVDSLRDVVGPLCRRLGERLARVFGVTEDLATRLERLHSPLGVTAFRVRQVGWSAVALAAGSAAGAVVRPTAAVVLLFVGGAPLLAFLALEQRVAWASARRQRRLFLELAVVSEQLAMLLSAGFSLGSALGRLADRGHGVCAEDLRRVTSRVRQGLTEVDALREWAAVARVPGLDRLVAVLALNREADDLGRLVSEESRAIRRDAQRELVQTMERRGQSVWIPVTVATLVPGVVFLSIPFIEALRLFSGS